VEAEASEDEITDDAADVCELLIVLVLVNIDVVESGMMIVTVSLKVDS
jgi:hypothetical protein